MGILSKFLASHAVTTFIPALRTVEKSQLLARTAALAELVRKDYGGAYPFGIHLDGPFLNGNVKSSHPAEFVSAIDLGYARELIAASQGKLKLLTFAPELAGAEKLIELLLENGIIPSIGHSCADEETTLRAVDAGARRATDMYTVYPPADFRRSSVTDVILTDDRIGMELIMDGSFLSGRIIELSLRVKPARKVIAISDSYSSCISCLDFPALDSAWRNLRFNHPRIPETDACCCLTLNPAEDIGLFSRGELSPGKTADIVFFRCKDESLLATLAAGNFVYSSEHSLSAPESI
jgi:N-acetylglucosamine-6-phosphate deacetylase